MVKTTLASLAIALVQVLGAAQSGRQIASPAKTEALGTSKPEPKVELLVKGRVLDSEGRPVADASVTAGPIGPLRGRVPMTKSDAQGEFSVVVNQTGEFLVTAAKERDRYPNTASPFYYPHAGTFVRVTVIAGQPAPDATVQFEPRVGRLTVQALDAQTNQPVSAMISLCRTETPKFCYRSASRNNRGEYSVLPSSAPFTLQVSADGYEDVYGEPGQEGLQAMQVTSEAHKRITVLMRKADVSNKDRLPAPKTVSPEDGLTLYDVPVPRPMTVEWSPVPEAKSYTVELEFCNWQKPDGGKCTTGTHPLTWWRNPPPSGIEGTSYSFVFPGTQPGRWRVWAVDAKGRAGLKTPWTYFFHESELRLPITKP